MKAIVGKAQRRINPADHIVVPTAQVKARKQQWVQAGTHASTISVCVSACPGAQPHKESSGAWPKHASPQIVRRKGDPYTCGASYNGSMNSRLHQVMPLSLLEQIQP